MTGCTDNTPVAVRECSVRQVFRTGMVLAVLAGEDIGPMQLIAPRVGAGTQLAQTAR